MHVALQCSTTVGAISQIVDRESGEIVGNNSGLFLVRQAIKKWPGLTLIGPEKIEGNGFKVGPPGSFDPNRTLVVSMDVLETQMLAYRLRVTPRTSPCVVNLFWANVSDGDYKQAADKAALAVSCCYFPTFANSPKTERDIRAAVEKNIAAGRAHKARLGNALLGIDLKRVEPGRQELNDVPVVLFPGIYLFDRKQPLRWTRILDAVDRTHEFVGRVRVSPRHWDRMEREQMEKREWVDLAPQPSQQAYYDSLPGVDVALATSEDESYGLAFVEAMYAGAIGVFPDKPWTWSLVPRDYPFVYRDDADAVTYVRWILDDLPRARALVQQTLGMDRAHFEEHHDSDRFFDALERFALEHYPQLEEI